MLTIDPNDLEVVNWKRMKGLCDKHKVEFKNQSFPQLISTLKKRHFDTSIKRHRFTKQERLDIFEKSQMCVSCQKVLTIKSFELDHILALANGGTNDMNNIQMLCKTCHQDKTKAEKEDGYVKMIDTESSFNTVTKEIFLSKLCGSYAFIERLVEDTPTTTIKKRCEDVVKTEKRFYYEGETQIFYDKEEIVKSSVVDTIIKSKVYHLDINKCRKNNLYYSKYDYPVFTVMDAPVLYNSQSGPGLYYVECGNYFPLRGNGWYYFPSIQYCLEIDIIKPENIKYVVLSSMSVAHDHYNEFIDYAYSTLDPSDAKLAINGMIGNFKPKPRENWKSLFITRDSNEAYHKFLELNGSFINIRDINNENFYQVYNTYFTESEETESPIYNQILELEAIELHKLKTIIESKNGLVLDLNTDCISCVFKMIFYLLKLLKIKTAFKIL
jgi:5-methylcytosine-specific restriction protein A